MEARIIMNKLMKWDEILKEYPNQRIAISDIIWKDEKHRLIDSAIVVASENDGLSKYDLIEMAQNSNGKICTESTWNEIEASLQMYFN